MHVRVAQYVMNNAHAMQLKWFKNQLILHQMSSNKKQIATIDGIKSVAFPAKIGCGLAGGDWLTYLRLIRRFAIDNPHITVAVYDYKCSGWLVYIVISYFMTTKFSNFRILYV